MKKLEPPDSFHLQAAAGWLELGNRDRGEWGIGTLHASLRRKKDTAPTEIPKSMNVAAPSGTLGVL